MSIESIRVKNLRALADTQEILLKPITLLVGKNSAGKSTFARVFPLLRQSYEEKRRAPLLWWGKYVDFGTFDDAVNRVTEPKEISIGFDFEIQPNRRAGVIWYEDRWQEQFTIDKPTKFKLEIVFAADAGHTYVRRIIITGGELSCTIQTAPDGHIKEISSDHIKWTPSSEVEAICAIGELLPVPRYTRKSKSKDALSPMRFFNPMVSRVLDEIGKFGHKNTAADTLLSIASRTPIFGTVSEVKAALSNEGTANWRRGIAALPITHKGFDNLRRWLFINELPKLFITLNEEIRSLALGVRYLEPLRATAQRYYRPQELSVDEIDSKGENLAVYIYSMKTTEKNNFNAWILQHLGFEVFATRDGGHISLRVKFSGDTAPTNLADTGFGISQVLPIATQLWSSLSRRPKRKLERITTCFVVEQPELHLHPAFQEQLADLFVAATNLPTKDRHFPIIAETHSSSLINRLGELVSLGQIDKDDVQVVMFEQHDALSPVTIRTSTFDDDGVLQNWPFGFFTSGLTA